KRTRTHDQITQKPARSGNTADHAEKPLLTLLKNTAHNAERKLLKHRHAELWITAYLLSTTPVSAGASDGTSRILCA
ncbi:MAG: hypothetical protein IIZ50_03080, partial [Bifidobacterium sp.]|nr:hypothetical protein [Bifidobacterium sp.]